MKINDLDLYMKFQRQPRVLGTQCFYAPTNKLLIPDGIKKGEKVFIVDYTQSDDDVYVTVAPISFWSLSRFGDGKGKLECSPKDFKTYVEANIPPANRVMVIWKDLAQ